MYKYLTLFACTAAVAMGAAVDHWAVLVAGSNGYWNYRHQADICRAYNILVKNGMPAENIIVMAYDDVARDPQNPYPGQLFNKPDGPDVYKGCQIDYRGEDVNPKNFLAILKGEDTKVKGGTGRVLKSTKSSKVFINFSDHGSYGLIQFPNDDYLYANDF
jgi:legumain